MASGRPADYQLSAWIRSQNDAAAPPTISSTTLDEVAKGLPRYRVSEKQLLFLRALEHKTAYPGQKVHIVTHFDFTLAWCSSAEELEYIIRSLLARALVQLDEYNDPKDSFSLQLTITPNGWSLLDESNKVPVLSNQVFVAMAFSNDLLPAWKTGIEPAIRKAKYLPYRVDAQPHIDRIDNKIVTEIRNSRFLVADVTLQRPGVYFEAGFAIGLGLPVIWSVKASDLGSVHFDTRQYNHIVWDTEAQLADQLYLFISALMGHGTAA
jgi:nucleoside 2-deoxyribosyltransferase